MGIKAGLVGLPNVGKSSLFNALTKSSIPAENYPFCTIDPHVAITYVPDDRLEKLLKIFKSEKIIPTTMQFVDIAGLVAGASKGEGLGNQFLSHILEVDLVLHVLRCFEDSSITHVHNKINPLHDFEVIVTELMLKDLDVLEKREEKLTALLKSAKIRQATTQQIKEWEDEKSANEAIKDALMASNFEKVQSLVKAAKEAEISIVHLLSGKNYLIIANVSEDEMANSSYDQNVNYLSLVQRFGRDRVIAVSARLEAELSQLNEEESLELRESLGIVERGLDKIIRKSYEALDLITFFTCGPKEIHAWSIPKNTKVPVAGGEIHSDLQRGFICCEVYNCKDLFELGSEAALKSHGKFRIEGKEYVVVDGDILHIRFNV